MKKSLPGVVFALAMIALLVVQPFVPGASTPVLAQDAPPYLNPALSAEARAADLLSRMTLEEKIGQMTQPEKGSVKGDDVTTYFLGSVLSGGGGSPQKNTPDEWRKMVVGYNDQALKTRLKIPLIYGVDAVHGHNNVIGATIYPHNVGLGATGDADLVARIGQATANDLLATGVTWNFAPVVAVPQDIRWGRNYEGFSENTDLVTKLSTAYLVGLQGTAESGIRVLGTPKHFIGDGGTAWGSSTTNNYRLDQGDTLMDEATLRRLFLPPYQAAIEAGALSIMASFSSWNGLKMHAQKYLLTDVLKTELGFSGFIVSDWAGIDQVDKDYYKAVVTSINAGVDMNMVPYDYKRFIETMKKAVDAGDIPMARIDDAVTRILVVKFRLGLFENPTGDPALLAGVGDEASRALAREAVVKSLVLLKNANQALPIAKDTPTIYVAGSAADNIGLQSGGWTISWQGSTDARLTPGSTILDGVNALAKGAKVVFDPAGTFRDERDAAGALLNADLGIVVVAEKPYAEGVGDAQKPAIGGTDVRMIRRVRERVKTLVVVVMSGRPIEVEAILADADALVAAWLPGSEGAAVADALFGDQPFTGKLPYTWMRKADQLPFDFETLPTEGCDAPLFPFGYGLTVEESTSPWLDLAVECAPAEAVATPAPAATTAAEVTVLAPDGAPGETYLAPFPVAIKLDGEAGDWAGVPRVALASPSGTASMHFAATADDKFLYLLAEVEDANIVSGEHGADYWNEDSVEFYINASGDLTATSYGPGIAQMTFPPLNADKKPEEVVIGGVQGPQVRPQVVTRLTGTGYVVEVAVALQQEFWTITPEDGAAIGFQVHLNGSEAFGRDTKLIWSVFDTADQSYQNPSLFGQLIFHAVSK